MKIRQLLNNNVVMALDDNGDEVVVMGTGLAFKAKKGDEIPKEEVQKVFMCKEFGSKLYELIEDIPIQYLEIAKSIIEYAETEFGWILNKQIYLALTDHLHFAVKRYKDNINLDNPFLYEVKQYYYEEYQAGLYGKELIEESFDIRVSDEEAGYIAMHIIEAKNHQSRKELVHILELVNELMELVDEVLNMKLVKDSLPYNRLLIHVKYFVKRFILNKEYDQEDIVMDNMVRTSFQEEYECVMRISEFVKGKYGRDITNLEANYLIFHLRNCRSKKNERR